MKAFLNSLQKRDSTEGAQNFDVLYTDEVSQKYTRSYSRTFFDLKVLEGIAKNEASRFNAEPPISDLTGIIVGMEIDITTPPPPPPQEEIDRTNFLNNWRLYLSFTRAIDAELVPPDDQEFTDLHKTLVNTFKREYIPLM